MHFTTLAIAAAGLGLAAAHGGDGVAVPNIMAGRRAMQDFTAARRQIQRRAAHVEPVQEASELEKRQSVGRCGPNYNNQVCDAGYCCSSAGWCGQGYLYCSAPSCMIEYGPSCDANIRPDGPDTANIARPKIGSIPYGKAIYHCENYGDIALTFDDGPYTYTEDLLNKLKAYDAKATFYITGNNLGKGKINDPATKWPAIIRRMVAEGHQIASHTWSHQRLTTVSAEKFRNQMIYNEIAFADLLGYFPTYMRPPYSACDATCEGYLNDLGYHITYFNLDTEGYLHDSPQLIQTSKDIWDSKVEGVSPANNKWLQIEHDPVYQTVYNLTDYMLESLFRNGFKSVTVGECLGDPKENWYRSVGNAPSSGGSSSSSTRTSSASSRAASVASSTSRAATPTGSLTPSTNGRCGPNFGFTTCANEPGATCCSSAGWCGNTADHCGASCQPLYGNCAVSSARASSSAASVRPVSAASSSSARPASSSSARASSSATTRASSAPLASGTAPATANGRCGSTQGGTTCAREPLGATCCSRYGWCGSSTDHCGAGCQAAFGTCGTAK
ncbi:putative peptidoglycan-N-acetylglucosamine deacetylase [Colletotrichum orbiculare MAFF 240422]|uniref:Peptidoglycan-N-acetylglucosamine deacetylase n=1 Tax=Colletotrichum orbiculare (strain 104-T / ATCC 96160 / CBS 514.97 / LARS 414 / MAFF 240422) TaxID=1213857 RepID=N4VW34_COLOR|nr:putative peptidoglycan-N-acetylglucosamine deacetylase [Colletotrichum orbiculare MAFF 240422]